MQICTRPTRGLQIENLIEAAIPEYFPQPEPSRHINGGGFWIEDDLVGEAARRDQGVERGAREHGDVRVFEVIADCCHRPERLHDIAKRAQFDDEDSFHGYAGCHRGLQFAPFDQYLVINFEGLFAHLCF